MSTSLGMMQRMLPDSWQPALAEELEQDYMRELAAFLDERRKAGISIYPAEADWFAAFAHTPFDTVKVVILGQDPYHGPGQAHGLSFSVPDGIKTPPSLRNIYKELARDFGADIPGSGNLSHWADQGVLLLNATLSVEAGKAGAHQKRGWERFTDAAIRALNERSDGIVFMLWGAYAQSKRSLIDSERHLVLQAPHPSPLSAHRGFIGCSHFSEANAWLEKRGGSAIRWIDTAPQLSLQL